MGKLSLFEVSFSNNLQGVFYAGQAVQGHVTVELKGPMKIRGIHLQFEGQAYVHWEETTSTNSDSDDDRDSRNCSASEEYFSEDILLAGRWKQQSGDNIHLPAGSHTFPFAFPLQLQLPSSFEGEHGHVRYSTKAIIDKPWMFNHETERQFTVIGLLDLNRDPNATMPAHGSDSKTLCCLCCESGPVSANFTIDRRGYVPGEAIILKAEIDNQSSRRINSSSVKLIMVTTFSATRKTRTSSRVVAKLKHGEIDGGGHDDWNGDQLVIPPLPPSFLAGCNIIDIRYFLKLEVTPSGPSSDLEVPLKVIIGTIPLQSVQAQHPPTAPHVEVPMIMPNPGMAGGAYPPPGAGAYPQPETYPHPAGAYPQPETYPHSAGAYPPPGAGAYPQPDTYPHPAGAYPPPGAGAYPQPDTYPHPAGAYPPPGAGAYPQPETYPHPAGAYHPGEALPTVVL